MCKWLWRLLLLLTVKVAFSGEIVDFLPGFDGQLPFKLETGYISVGDSELFYYFIESQGNPLLDPLLLWLSGGPGCSSFGGLAYEIGPLEFDIDNYVGGLPKLKYNPYAWTRAASIIFLDAPVGTGFSYAKATDAWPTSDTKFAEQSYQFLRKWLLENPQYLLVELFIGGDSYSGIPVPLITQKIVEGNEAMNHPYMNLKQLEKSCNGTYVNVDPSNTACVAALQTYEMCVKDINTQHILKPICYYPRMEVNRRSMKENFTDFILPQSRIFQTQCRSFKRAITITWANNQAVQEALHVRKETVPYWSRCNFSLSYTQDIASVVDVHRYLSTKSLLLLVISGDHDMEVSFVGTQGWIESLNLSINDKWRPWFVDGQVVGYTTRYHVRKDGFSLTFVTIKGAGHPAPEFCKRECKQMFERWIHRYPI